MATQIIGEVNKLGLDRINCIAQCHDVAFVLSRRFSEFQKKVQEIVQKNCIDVHRYARRLNLIVVSTASCIKDVRNFFGLPEAVLLLHQHFDMTSL